MLTYCYIKQQGLFLKYNDLTKIFSHNPTEQERHWYYYSYHYCHFSCCLTFFSKVTLGGTKLSNRNNGNKSMFTYPHMQKTWHCPHLMLCAVLLQRRPCSSQSISPTHWVHSSKPTARCCSKWNRQTDRRTPYHFTDLARHAMRTITVIWFLEDSCPTNSVKASTTITENRPLNFILSWATNLYQWKCMPYHLHQISNAVQ